MRKAYRGYLIGATFTGRSYWISRDGFHIGWAGSEVEAMRKIDQLFTYKGQG